MKGTKATKEVTKGTKKALRTFLMPQASNLPSTVASANVQIQLYDTYVYNKYCSEQL